MTELWSLGITDLLDAYAGGNGSPTEAVRSAFARIGTIDPSLGAFTALREAEALVEAAEASNEIARGGVSKPLHGVPVAVKELFDVAGMETTFGSEVFAGRIAERDAAAVAALKRAGAIVLGLTRTHEFAWGITTQHERRGGTRNPWALDRIPGGSSGGSAAAVAAGFVPLALGSDTGGSIRIPAAFCGISGVKPSFGAVDVAGACPLAPSLDHVGPLARSIEDCGLALAVIGDIRILRWRDDLRGMRVVHADDLHIPRLQDDHARIFASALGSLVDLGATIDERRFPGASEIRDLYARVQRHEGYEVHTELLGTYPSRSDDYSAGVRRALEMSASVTDDDYLAAMMERDRLRSRFRVLLKDADVLVTPVAAGPPSFIDDPDNSSIGGQPIPLRDMVMTFTTPQDLTGLPAAVVPAGIDDHGLPVGLQFTALTDETVLTAARVFQKVIRVGWPTAIGGVGGETQVPTERDLDA